MLEFLKDWSQLTTRSAPIEWFAHFIISIIIYNKMIIPSIYTGIKGQAVVPSVDLVPSASFKRENMTTRNPALGYVDPMTMDKPAMHNQTTSISTARRVLMCKNDLRVKVGRPAKHRFALNQTSGIGRKTSSIFTREHPNNGRIMRPSDNHVASRLNKLGIPK